MASLNDLAALVRSLLPQPTPAKVSRERSSKYAALGVPADATGTDEWTFFGGRNGQAVLWLAVRTELLRDIRVNEFTPYSLFEGKRIVETHPILMDRNTLAAGYRIVPASAVPTEFIREVLSAPF